MLRQAWEVVGGKKDGLLVRTGKSLKSPEAAGRLATGSCVEELELDGDRLRYYKLAGAGPDTGWVSLKLKGVELLERASRRPASATLTAQDGAALGDSFKRTELTAEVRGEVALVAAKGEVCLQVLVSDASPSSAAEFHIEAAGGRLSVRRGRAPAPGATMTVASEAALLDAWNGGVDFAQFKMEGEVKYVRRLFPILFVNEQHPEDVDRRTPADGVLRPPEGGQAPSSSSSAQAGAAPSTPVWLVPDGLPEKKNKLLLLALPLAGHIVHLTRVAAWFVERPNYEVHLGCLSGEPPAVPVGVRLHSAEALELTSVMEVVQDNLRNMGMRQPWEGGLGDNVDFETEGYKLLRFLLRLVTEVRPTVVLADSGFANMGFLQAICQVHKCSLCLVFSPGIKERWIAESASKHDSKEMLQQHSSKMPQIDLEQVMAGTFDESTLPEGIQNTLKIPGMSLLRLIQVFAAVMTPEKAKAPVALYPSASWMVEEKPVGNEVFTCTLLPLPELVEGTAATAQLSAEDLRGAMDAELHIWLFSSDSQDPIVYVAFGTIVQGAEPIVRKLVPALEAGRWRVLWSLPKDMQQWLPSGLPKERWCIRDFVPQREILRCDRVACFVSHCGANSTIEAMSSGVPMVCHPFYLDQYDWARTVRKHLRAGVQVDKFDSDSEAIRLAVAEVLEDPSFRANAQAVAKRLRAQAAQVKRLLGPDMAPKEHLGPGVPVIAALIVSMMKGKDPLEIAKLVDATNQ